MRYQDMLSKLTLIISIDFGVHTIKSQNNALLEPSCLKPGSNKCDYYPD